MKRIFLVLLFSALFIFSFGQSGTIELPDSGKELTALIPQSWRVLSFSSGDLNEDGIDDWAFVIQNTLKKDIKAVDGIGVDTLDLNPRILGIYFGSSDGVFVKKLQSDTFIPLRDSPTMAEPFKGLEILESGVIKLDFYLWQSMGNWYAFNHHYKFKFQNEVFELVGYDSIERHRATGDIKEYHINFSLREMKINFTSLKDRATKESTEEELKTFELPDLKSIQSLKKPFQWEFMGVII